MDKPIKCPECGVNNVVERTRLQYSWGKALVGGLILAGVALCSTQIYAVSYWAGNLAPSIPRIPLFLAPGGDSSMHFICAGGVGIFALLMILFSSRTSYTYYHCLSCKNEWEKTL